MTGIFSSAWRKKGGILTEIIENKNILYRVFSFQDMFILFQERWLYILAEKLHLMINRMMDVKNHLF